MAQKKGKSQSVRNAVLRVIQKSAAGGRTTPRGNAVKRSSSKSAGSEQKSTNSVSHRLNGELYRQTTLPKSGSSAGLPKIRLSSSKKQESSSKPSKKTEVKAKKIVLSAESGSSVRKLAETFGDAAKQTLERYQSRSVLPVADFQISSSYGEDRGTHLHSGIDLAIPTGTTVAAAKKGTVSFAGWGNGYGYRVVIDHEDGTQTTYNHLSDIGVKEGDKVNAGTSIALSGNTGNSTGPHLHFEVKKDGRYVDPTLYFDFENGTTVTGDGQYTSQMSTVSETKSTASGQSSSGKGSSSRSSSSSSSSSSGRSGSSKAKKVVLPSVKYSAPSKTSFFNAVLPSVDEFTIQAPSARSSFSGDMNPLLTLVPSYRVRKKTTKTRG